MVFKLIIQFQISGLNAATWLHLLGWVKDCHCLEQLIPLVDPAQLGQLLVA
jgi:hypothetical protein